MMFSPGKEVEISFDKDYLRDVWFPATITEDSSSGSFLVEYKCPGSREEFVLEKVTVDHNHIRPSPPLLRERRFSLLEKVDAFFDFGWWTGVITKELAENRYTVYFKYIKKQREVAQSELRPHIEWKDGMWSSSSQNIPFDDADDTNAAVPESASNSGAKKDDLPFLNSKEKNKELTTTVEKQSGIMSTPNKKMKQTEDNDDKHLQSSKEMKERHESDPVCELNTSPGAVPDNAVFSKPKQHMFIEQPNEKTDSISNSKKVLSKHGNVGDQIKTSEVVRKRGRLATAKPASEQDTTDDPEGKIAENSLQKVSELNTTDMDKKGSSSNPETKKPQSSVHGIMDTSAETRTEDLVQKESITEETPKRKRGRPPRSESKIPKASVQSPLEKSAEKAVEGLVAEPNKVVLKTVVIGLESNGIKGSRATKPAQVPIQESLKRKRGEGEDSSVLSTPTSDNKEQNEAETGGTTSQKRGRGRPPRSVAKSYEEPTVNRQNGNSSANEMVLHDEGTPLVEEADLEPEKEALEPDVALEQDKPLRQVRRTRKKKKSFSMKKKILVEKGKQEKVGQASNELPEHPSVVKRAGRPRTISLNSELSPKDVSKQVDKDLEMTDKSESSADKLPGKISDDQTLSTWFEGIHSPTTTVASGVEVGSSLGQQNEANATPEEVKLPFEKNISVWEAVEAMEVFRQIPQKPHFRPLYECKESSREGLAIGHMVTFSSIVGKISNLQFDNSRSNIEDFLELLVELEKHGFDVKVVRDRLIALLLVKGKQEELQAKSKEAQGKIAVHNLEISKAREEIEDIDKQIKELQEKRNMAISRIEKMESEVVDMNSIHDGIESARLEFDRLTSAPW